MVGKTQLNSDRIASIIALHKEDKTSKEICDITGVSLRSVQRWLKKYNDSGASAVPTHEKRPGKARKTIPRALDVLKSQVEADPRLSAKELREKNPKLLSDVSVRTVQRRLFEDLKYRNCRLRPKPPQQTHGGGGRVYRRPDSDPHDPKYSESTVRVPASLTEDGGLSSREAFQEGGGLSSREAFQEDGGLSSRGAFQEDGSLSSREAFQGDGGLSWREAFQEGGGLSSREDSDEDLEKPSITYEEIDPTPDIGDTKEGASIAVTPTVVVPPKTAAITDGGRDPDDDAQEDVLNTSMAEMAGRVVPAEGHGDEFHHFGMYVASQLRGMPPRAAVEVQLEIQRALTMKRLQCLQ